MDGLPASSTLRIVRPTKDLDTTETFWVEGVGLEALWRNDHPHAGEHALLMVGVAGAVWHLEIVDDPAAAAESRPSAEDLLVLYLGESADPQWVDRICAHGGTVVPSRNPYWDQWGVTIKDPDGHLLVLSHRTWGPRTTVTPVPSQRVRGDGVPR
jgi:catechol 2,3-dioxygenase-like lactoylglutathione lyase family enzyme